MRKILLPVVLFCSIAIAEDINDVARTYLYLSAEVDRTEVTPQHLAVLRSWRGKAQQLVDKMKSSNISEKLKKAQDQLINAMGDADIKLWEQQEFSRQWNGCWDHYAAGIPIKSTDGKTATFHELDKNQYFVDTEEGSFLLPPIKGDFPKYLQLYFGTKSAKVVVDGFGDLKYIVNFDEPETYEKITLIKAVKEGADNIHRKIMRQNVSDLLSAVLTTDKALKITAEASTVACKKAVQPHKCPSSRSEACNLMQTNLKNECDKMKSKNRTLVLINRDAHEGLEKIVKGCGEYITADDKTALVQFLQQHPPSTTTHQSAESVQ